MPFNWWDRTNISYTHTHTHTQKHTHTHTHSSNFVASPISADSSPTIEPVAPIFEAGSTSVQANSPQSLD